MWRICNHLELITVSYNCCRSIQSITCELINQLPHFELQKARVCFLSRTNHHPLFYVDMRTRESCLAWWVPWNQNPSSMTYWKFLFPFSLLIGLKGFVTAHRCSSMFATTKDKTSITTKSAWSPILCPWCPTITSGMCADEQLPKAWLFLLKMNFLLLYLVKRD